MSECMFPYQGALTNICIKTFVCITDMCVRAWLTCRQSGRCYPKAGKNSTFDLRGNNPSDHAFVCSINTVGSKRSEIRNSLWICLQAVFSGKKLSH